MTMILKQTIKRKKKIKENNKHTHTNAHSECKLFLNQIFSPKCLFNRYATSLWGKKAKVSMSPPQKKDSVR